MSMAICLCYLFNSYFLLDPETITTIKVIRLKRNIGLVEGNLFFYIEIGIQDKFISDMR